MIFDHRVKHDGILYEAGQDVPIEEKITTHAEDVAEKKVASSSHLFPEPESEKTEQPKRRGRKPKE